MFDATDFWIEKAKTVSGKIGLSATIIDSPWFNLGLFILGVLYLRYVGEVQRPLRHPAWPILGWAVVGVVALTFWSVLVAGYVAIRVPQQMAGKAEAQIESLTQTNQELQQKVAALEQQSSSRVLTDEQKKKLKDVLSEIPPGVTYKVDFNVGLTSCFDCPGYMGDLVNAWNEVPGWKANGVTHFGLNPRLVGVVVVTDAENCPPEELRLVMSALRTAGIQHEGMPAKGQLGSECAVAIGSKPQK